MTRYEEILEFLYLLQFYKIIIERQGFRLLKKGTIFRNGKALINEL